MTTATTATAAITITWTAASKGKKNGRAVSRRFDATLRDGRYIAGVAEAKSEDDLAAAAEADLARFGAAGQGPFVWAQDTADSIDAAIAEADRAAQDALIGRWIVAPAGADTDHGVIRDYKRDRVEVGWSGGTVTWIDLSDVELCGSRDEAEARDEAARTEHVVYIRVRDAMVHACEIWERCGSAEDAAASCLTAERMGHRVDRVEIVTR